VLELPFNGYFETPFDVQIPDHPHSHQVRVWLPPSYHHTADEYPVLWVTDNLLEHAVSAVTGSHFTEAPEVIVVAIGAPLGLSSGEYGSRRIYDFMPTKDLLTWDEQVFEAGVDINIGGAAPFLDYLTGPLRRRVEESYRTSGDHGLAGHSGGAMFALYSLFAGYGAFSKYLIGSPAYGVDVERLEAEHHAEHGDFSARLFLAAGGAEMTTPSGAFARTLSTMTSLCERLVSRAYESLDLQATIYPGCTHSSVMAPLFSDGLRWLWRDAAKASLISSDGGDATT
jgi:predicted alpha/beta superfamily hydrolase